MCGRTALGLKPEIICNLCKYRKSNRGRFQVPKWIEVNKNKVFKPSYNIFPGMMMPVMILDSHLELDIGKKKKTVKRVICPMQWGLIPHWFKAGKNRFKYNTSNCRSETILTKTIFKSTLDRGRRCVILMQGFYEWRRQRNKVSQPYFIYMNGNSTVNETNLNEHEHYNKLTKLAGLFDTSFDENGIILHTFTIITTSSIGSNLACLHNRMPVVLESEEELNIWLNYDNCEIEDALKLLKPVNCLNFHPVSIEVNNVKNNSFRNLRKINPDSSVFDKIFSKSEKVKTPVKRKRTSLRSNRVSSSKIKRQ